MKRKVVSMLVTGLVIASLAGCGARTEATDQVSENSDVVEAETENENEETEGNTEDANAFAGAEDENIVLYAERGNHDYLQIEEMEYEFYEGTVTATEDIPLYDGEGYSVGHIKNGSTISVTERWSGWTRFENPIAGTDYDYLYVLRDYVASAEEIHLDPVTMLQGIQEYINTYGFEEGNYTFLNESTSDMEVYEFRMDSAYTDQMMYEYWLAEMLTRNDEVDLMHYETLYIECEEDTDGWIICRVYYKDPIDFGY